MGFVEKLVSSRKNHIYLIKGKDATGHMAYYFILLDAAKERMFQASLEAGNYDLESYGRILFSGYGAEPQASVWEELESTYGCKRNKT